MKIKKKSLFVIVFLLFSISSFSQNLINNWSFEDMISCPNGINQINKAIGWISFMESPDYFNACDTNTTGWFVGVPSNLYGFQYAHTGNAYVGFSPFTTGGINKKECFGTQLSQPLVIGQKYYVSFYVVRVVNNSLSINVATNNIGVKFSTNFYSWGNVPIDNHSQVHTDSIITDTLNWIKISGSFVADSAYLFFYISNFFKDSVTTHIQYDYATIAYYYVDDIIVSSDSLYAYGINKENLSKIVINIYPNPATDILTIESPANITTAEVYDLSGKLLLNIPLNTNQIDISSLEKGLYFIKLTTKEGSMVRKFVKE